MSLHISKAAERVLVDLQENSRLDPETVVKTAKSPANPLHKYFIWDNDKAAHAHRISIAQSMIRTVRVLHEVVDHGVVRNISVPKFVSDPAADANGGYRTIESVIGRARVARDVYSDTLNEIASAKGHLERALAVGLALECADAIRRAVDQMVKLATRVAREKTEKRKSHPTKRGEPEVRPTL